MKSIKYGLVALLVCCLLTGATVGKAQSLPTDYSTNVLDWFTFDDTTNWTDNWGDVPLSYTNLACLVGDGPALLMDNTNGSCLQYPLLVDDGKGGWFTNLALAQGTVYFWVFLTNSASSGWALDSNQWGTFIEAGFYTSNATYGWWSLYTDGTNILFSAQGNDGSQTNYLSVPLNSTPGAGTWMDIALTYGSNATKFYINGELLSTGPGMSLVPSLDVISNSFYIGSSGSSNQLHAVIDDLYTLDCVVDTTTLACEYNSDYANYFLNPGGLTMGQVTPIEFIASAPSYMTNDPVFRAICGSGYLQYLGGMVGWAPNTNVWMTNVTAKLDAAGQSCITFSIGGGTNDGSLYDIYGTGALLGGGITNSQWSWLGQGYAGCRYSISNIPNAAAYFILGTPQDTDNDGLPDAYEILISHTDPQNPDTAGSGLADWFWVVYFGGNNTLDPYSLCSSGDGWTLLQAYQNGWNPAAYQNPPAPQGFSASYNPATGAVVLSWQPSPGPVTNYVLSTPTTTGTINLSATTTSFTDLFPTNALNPLSGSPVYYLCAQYPGGASAWSSATLLDSSMAVDGQIIRGPDGNYYVAVPALPAGVSAIRVSRHNAFETLTSIDIPVANFTNGIALIAPDWVASLGPEGWPLTDWTMQTVNANGVPSAPSCFTGQAKGIPFFNGTEQLQQNLTFGLRAADFSQYLRYQITSETYLTDNDDSAPAFPSSCQSLKTQVLLFFTNSPPSQYAFASYYHLGSSLWAFPDEFLPFSQNHTLRTFVFATNNVDLGSSAIAGISGWQLDPNTAVDTAVLTTPLLNQFVPPTNLVSIPAILSLADSQYTCSSPWCFCDGSSCGTLDNVGLAVAGGLAEIAPNATNWFGLPFVSEMLGYWQNGTASYLALNGGAASAYSLAAAFPATAAPALQTVGYYFGRPGIDPLPGQSGFSPTNTTPILIAGFGQTFDLAGYAKQVVTNGYPNVFGYLGQYFTNAFKMNASGNVTTQATGLLSPYGEFFPTEPGRVALLTMPDPVTGQQGTGVVNVIKLQLDVNHDGNMDLMWGGPDNTSPSRPFVFWLNNDCDWETTASDPGKDIENPYEPDCDGIAIRSPRDLEDYARLWICGIPALTNVGYQVTLSWTNVITGSPGIRLFTSVETNGGIGYLTDTDIAAQQSGVHGTSFGQFYQLAAISFTPMWGSLDSFTFPADFFTNNANKYFLFEGWTKGMGELRLTITQNSQTIAQTSVWIDLHDIHDFYEEARATNVTSNKPPSSLVSQYQVLNTTSGMPDETKQVIVYVHGINRPEWDAQNEAETLFKRLYWSGYHGRFARFRWPCDYLPPNNWWPFTFNKSEFWSYKSATALKNYLNYLKNRADLAGYDLDVIAHSQGGAITSEALSQGAPFDNCILTQGAVPAHCFDSSAPTLPALLAADARTPTPFSATVGGYDQCWTNISGNIVNFFNTNDFALATGSYFLGLKQTNWEVNQETEKPEAFLGGPSYIFYPTSQTSVAYFLIGFGNYTVTDWQESRSMVARSLTAAIGAQGPATATAVQGIIGSSVDLAGNFAFGNTRPEHSAQFTRPIQTVWGYYDQILLSFGIKPITR